MARPSPAVAARERLTKKYQDEAIKLESEAEFREGHGQTEAPRAMRSQANRSYRRSARARLMAQGYRSPKQGG